ncbi:hypothetical protein HPB47_016789 [Ixodes persulcatus]|uniref:Uncharacterized protein n=1 Tax=Ixodes persulcatus TaxID=34615 RepID=A0AC60QQY9_IXOPE|nr:hypothetical protein HPB47_016789 [Ixodes persulcatus]
MFAFERCGNAVISFPREALKRPRSEPLDSFVQPHASVGGEGDSAILEAVPSSPPPKGDAIVPKSWDPCGRGCASAKPPREESLGAPAITCVYVTATRPTARLRCSSVPARQMEPACFGVFPERSKVKNGWKQLVSHVDEVTGRTVTAPLSRVRLRPGAVPSKFPGCPDYLSKHHARREDPDSKRLRQEASAMERALAESIDSFRNEEEADRILSIKDLSDHLKNVKSAFWHAIEGNGHLTLVHIVETEAPWIKYSIVVKPDLTLTLHFAKTPVTRLGSNLLIPSIANSKRRVVDLLESVENWDNDLDSSSESSHNDICATIRFLLDKLSVTQSEERRNAPRPSYNIVVTEDALSKIKDIVPVLAYVAGYAVYATVKKLKCENCKNALTTDRTIAAATGNEYYHLIKDIDRGGLLYPAMTAVNAVAHNYVVVEEMSKRVDFLTMSNQRQLVTELTLDLLIDEDCSDFDVCEQGHTRHHFNRTVPEAFNVRAQRTLNYLLDHAVVHNDAHP